MRLFCQIVFAAATGTAGFLLFTGMVAHAIACVVCAVAVFVVTPSRED